jgi:hypothetical protein
MVLPPVHSCHYARSAGTDKSLKKTRIARLPKMRASLREHLFHSCHHARSAGTDKSLKKTRIARLPKMRASLREHLFHSLIIAWKSHESEEILVWEQFQKLSLQNNNSFIWQEALFPSDEADLTISRNVFPPKSLFSSGLLDPEELIQRTPEHLTDLDAQVDGRIIVTLFDRADRLPGHPYRFRQVRL